MGWNTTSVSSPACPSRARGCPQCSRPPMPAATMEPPRLFQAAPAVRPADSPGGPLLRPCRPAGAFCEGRRARVHPHPPRGTWPRWSRETHSRPWSQPMSASPRPVRHAAPAPAGAFPSVSSFHPSNATPHKSCAPSSRIFLRGNGVQNALNSAAIPVLLSLFHTKISRDPATLLWCGVALTTNKAEPPKAPPKPPPRELVKKVLELFAAAGVPEFPQRLGFDLADAFAGHVELLAHFLQRARAAVVQPEAQP